MQTLTIGSLTVESRFILAPMAGYTDLAFRLLCREYGAGLCYSEMLHCEEVVNGNLQAGERLATCEEEQPVAVQLYGSDPEMMADAAARLSELPVSVIDINMGCPVPRICALGAGAALMRKQALARRIITAVRARASVPVTVKIRSGIHQHSITAPDFALMAEEAGAQAVAVHARTCSEGFSGPVDFGLLARVRKRVTIPVIGNGGVRNHEEGLRMLNETGCDGVMIGRAALAAPWNFSPGINPLPSMAFRARALLRHIDLIEQYYPQGYPLRKIQNHAWKYFHDRPDIRSLRQRIAAATSIRHVQEIVSALA